jgi:hypothetical protein
VRAAGRHAVDLEADLTATVDGVARCGGGSECVRARFGFLRRFSGQTVRAKTR